MPSTRNSKALITGIGVVSSHGVGLSGVWDRIKNGSPALQRRAEWTNTEIGERLVGLAHDKQIKMLLPRLRPPYPPRYSQLSLAATELAISDACLDLEAVDNLRVGTTMCTDLGPLQTVEDYLTTLFLRGPAAVSPLNFSRTVANVALGDVARYFRLRGPSALLLGSEAATYGADLIEDQQADIVICTAADELREMIVWTYSKLGLLATNSEVPCDGSFEPNGLVLGEAAVSIVLESPCYAARRKARAYASVLGHAAICDTRANFNIKDRCGEDIEESAKRALEHACADANELDFVIAASSTTSQLAVEIDALSRATGRHNLSVHRFKHLLGETLGSSGLLAIALAAVRLDQGRRHTCDVRSVRTPSQGTIALANSVRIGGSNTSVVLQEM